MKSRIKIFCIALMLSMTISVFAINEEPEFIVRNLEEKTIYFEVKDITSKDFEIRIQDEEGITLFSEYSLSTAIFERTYNLSELPNGVYYILLEDDSKIQIIPVIIESDGLKIDLENKEIIQKLGVG